MALFFSSNPFRVVGVLSNSGLKIIQKNLSKLKAFSKLGKALEFDFDFPFLNLEVVDRSSDMISKVESRILLDENKLKYSLFWFLDVSSIDSIALANLIKGDSDKALEIWAKAMKSGEVNSKNFSAFNNASTLLLLLQLESSKIDRFRNDSVSISKLKQALDQKLKLINSDFFVDFCLSIGVKSEVNSTQIQSVFTETLLDILNQNFTNKQLLELVNGLDAPFSESVSNSLVKEPMSNIKDEINTAAAALKSNTKEGLVIGKLLIKNTVSDLKYLKETLGEDHYNYESLADKLSNQILQCGINFFNETGDDQDYISSYEYALFIAPNDKSKTRAKECIKHCEDEKEHEIITAVQFLQSVKETYEINVKEIKSQVKQALEEGNYPLYWFEIDSLIKNSIDWDKVNELLDDAVNNKILKNIKYSKNNDLKDEFVGLINWLNLISKSSSSDTLSIVLNKYEKLEPKLPFEIISSEVINSNEKPLYSKFIKNIQLVIKIQSFAEGSIKFCMRNTTKMPHARINSGRRSLRTPAELFASDVFNYQKFLSNRKKGLIYFNKNIEIDTNQVVLSGWGDSSSIRKNLIEVYVDECLIHSKNYTVNIAPSEIIKDKILAYERTLQDVNKKWYAVGLDQAKKEMTKLMKFKVFRTSLKRLNEIQSQQAKIDDLVQKAKKEKQNEINQLENEISILKLELKSEKY